MNQSVRLTGSELALKYGSKPGESPDHIRSFINTNTQNLLQMYDPESLDP